MNMKLKTSVLPIYLLSLALFSGCASDIQKATTLYRDGQNDEALIVIERGLKANPENSEAKAIRTSIRSRWIDDKLIQVRLMRLGGNIGESETLLRTVILRQNEWQVFPSGAVFSTQSEEISYLARRVRELIAKAVSEKKPLLAQWLLNSNRTLLEDTLKTDVTQLQLQIQNVGKSFCSAESKNLTNDEFYGYRFLKAKCSMWGYDIPGRRFKNSVQLFGRLNFEFEVVGLSSELQTIVREAISKPFEKSHWYDEQSLQVLSLNLSGAFNSTIGSERIRRSQEYSVSVPYQHEEVRPKSTKSTSNGLLFQVLGALLVGSDQTRDNGNGTETVVSTRYRQEPRVHNYDASKFYQNIKVNWRVKASLLKNSQFMFDIKDNYKNISYEHNENFPAGNLAPEKRKIITNSNYLETFSSRIRQEASEQLSQHWIGQFCHDIEFQTPEAKTSPGRNEQVQRCLWGAIESAPGFAENWLLQTYGIDFKQLRSL
jgi:hypothetical protein